MLVLSAFGQSDRGTVTGTVADPGGSLIPGAAIVLENAATGVRFTSATTDTGNYTIPSVPAGTYALSVEQSGFRKHVQSGITVNVAQTARVDITLQIGSIAESVQITADAPLLKTESAEQSTLSGDQLTLYR
ncbi:MAG: carboxypeptidase-like regulatory domain-containing protein [Bryobacteraceae bacterium]